MQLHSRTSEEHVEVQRCVHSFNTRAVLTVVAYLAAAAVALRTLQQPATIVIPEKKRKGGRKEKEKGRKKKPHLHPIKQFTYVLLSLGPASMCCADCSSRIG